MTSAITSVFNDISLNRSISVFDYRSIDGDKIITDVPAEVQFPAMMRTSNPSNYAGWTEDRNTYTKQFRGSAAIAIGAIAKLAAMQEIKIKRRVVKNKKWYEEDVSPRHPLYRLLEEVNPFDTKWDLWYYSVAWRMLTGDTFIYKAKNGFGTPKQLWPMPSQFVHVVPSDTNFIAGYSIQGDGFGGEWFVPPENMIHIRNPNLDWQGSGRYYGMPAIKAAASTLDLEYEMQKRLHYQFKNYSKPGMVLKTDATLQPHQLAQHHAAISAQYGMAEKTGIPLILHGGFSMDGSVYQNASELDYTASLDKTLELTMATIGVPKAVVGMLSGANRQDVEASLIQCCKMTVDPLLTHFSEHLTQDLARDFDDNLIIRIGPCQVDSVDTLRKDIEVMIKAGAITPNEVRSMLRELDPLDKELGDKPVLVSGFSIQGSSEDSGHVEVPRSNLAGHNSVGDSKEGLAGVSSR